VVRVGSIQVKNWCPCMPSIKKLLFSIPERDGAGEETPMWGRQAASGETISKGAWKRFPGASGSKGGEVPNFLKCYRRKKISNEIWRWLFTLREKDIKGEEETNKPAMIGGEF